MALFYYPIKLGFKTYYLDSKHSTLKNSETNYPLPIKKEVFNPGHMIKKSIASNNIKTVDYYNQQSLYIKSINVKLNLNSTKIFSNLLKIESSYRSDTIKLSKPKTKKFKTIFFSFFYKKMKEKNNLKLVELVTCMVNFNNTYFSLDYYYYPKLLTKLRFFKETNSFFNNKTTLSSNSILRYYFNNKQSFVKTFDLKLGTQIQSRSASPNSIKLTNFNKILLNKLNLIKLKNLLLGYNKNSTTIINDLSISSSFSFLYVLSLINKNKNFYSNNHFFLKNCLGCLGLKKSILTQTEKKITYKIERSLAPTCSITPIQILRNYLRHFSKQTYNQNTQSAPAPSGFIKMYSYKKSQPSFFFFKKVKKKRTSQVPFHLLKIFKKPLKAILKYYINSLIWSSLYKLLITNKSSKLDYFNNILSNKNYLIKNLIKKNINEPLSILISFFNLYNRFFNFINFQYKLILFSTDFFFGTSNVYKIDIISNRIPKISDSGFIKILAYQKTFQLNKKKSNHWLNKLLNRLCNTQIKYLDNKWQHYRKQEMQSNWLVSKWLISNLILKNKELSENKHKLGFSIVRQNKSIFKLNQNNNSQRNLWLLQKKKHNNKSLTWLFKKYWFRTFFKTVFLSKKISQYKINNNHWMPGMAVYVACLADNTYPDCPELKMDLKLKKNTNTLFFKNIISSTNYFNKSQVKIKKELKFIYNSSIFLNTKFIYSLN